MNLTVAKSNIYGKITLPASKSVVHRLLIAASLSHGQTVVNNRLSGDDVRATAECLSQLGLKNIDDDGKRIIVSDKIKNLSGDISALNNISKNQIDLLSCDIPVENNIAKNKNSNEKNAVNCNNGGLYSVNDVINIDMRESGSTLRFMLPIICALNLAVKVEGHGRLPMRPIGELIAVLRSHGVDVASDTLPLMLRGQLTFGNYNITGGVSSQFISGLLFALPLLDGDSTIFVEGDIVSQNYIQLTLDVLAQFNVKITCVGNTFVVKGRQKYISPNEIKAEGDWSSACFFAVAAAVSGDIKLNGLDIKSRQSDIKILQLISDFGAEITKSNGITINKKIDTIDKTENNSLTTIDSKMTIDSGVENIDSDCIKIKRNKNNAISFSAKDCPDIVPIASVLAACAKGVSTIYDVDRLRLKESDRLSAIIEMLQAFKIDCSYQANCLSIVGGELEGATINSYGDHRIAMSAAIAGLVAKGKTTIIGCDCVSKSYEDFFVDYIKCGGKIL